jgi:hypothetical protein
MKCWEDASSGDRKLFEAISELLAGKPYLLMFLFDPQKPKLNGSSRDILATANGFGSIDLLLVRVVLDLWSGSGNVTVYEVLDAGRDVSGLIFAAIARLVA